MMSFNLILIAATEPSLLVSSGLNLRVRTIQLLLAFVVAMILPSERIGSIPVKTLGGGNTYLIFQSSSTAVMEYLNRK